MRRHLPSFLAALACHAATAGLPASAHRLAVERHRTTVGDWRLDIARDTFSGLVSCRLRARNGKASYVGRAVGFRFKRTWDVAEAIYRIDGGPPRASRDDRAELIGLRAPVETGGMMNPTEGIVWIPFARLAAANSVEIVARPGKRSRTYHFHGLKGLLAIGQARGCRPEGRFSR